MEPKPTRSADLLGAVAANVYMLLIIGVFTARLLQRAELGHWVFGLPALFVVIPLLYLFVSGFSTNRRLRYFVWLGLMIAFQIVELLLDFALQIDFRSVRWAVILYTMMFFGATGGMIGVAGQAGRVWTIVASSMFLVMAALAFISRSITGL
jgi:hypothetical protein